MSEQNNNKKIHNIQNRTFVGTDEVRISIRNALMNNMKASNCERPLQLLIKIHFHTYQRIKHGSGIPHEDV